MTDQKKSMDHKDSAMTTKNTDSKKSDDTKNQTR